MEVDFKADLIVEDEVIVELKSIEAVNAVRKKQLLTNLRLASKQIGILINLNEEVLKKGITGLINKYYQ